MGPILQFISAADDDVRKACSSVGIDMVDKVSRG